MKCLHCSGYFWKTLVILPRESLAKDWQPLSGGLAVHPKCSWDLANSCQWWSAAIFDKTHWKKHDNTVTGYWLVLYLPLWKIWESIGMIIPNIWKKTCSKPPTRLIMIFWFSLCLFISWWMEELLHELIDAYPILKKFQPYFRWCRISQSSTVCTKITGRKYMIFALPSGNKYWNQWFYSWNFQEDFPASHLWSPEGTSFSPWIPWILSPQLWPWPWVIAGYNQLGFYGSNT